MPINDIPPFMMSDEDTQSGKDLIDTLGEPAKEETTDTIVEETTTDITPETPKIEEKKDATPQDGEESEEGKERKDAIDVLKDEHPEDKKPDTTADTTQKPEDKKEVIVETPEDLLTKTTERIYQQAQDMTAKVTQTQELLRKTPVIKVDMPDVNKYQNQDGTLDLESYMSDYTKNLTMAIQSNLAGGPLAALMYGTLHAALLEDYGAVASEKSKSSKASALETKLQTSYPILKSNAKLAERFGDLVVTRWQRHVQESKTKNEDPGKVTYEWVEKELIEFLKDMNIDVKAGHTPDPVDRQKGGATLMDKVSTTTSKDAELFKDIDDMANLKKRSIF